TEMSSLTYAMIFSGLSFLPAGPLLAGTLKRRGRRPDRRFAASLPLVTRDCPAGLVGVEPADEFSIALGQREVAAHGEAGGGVLPDPAKADGRTLAIHPQAVRTLEGPRSGLLEGDANRGVRMISEVERQVGIGRPDLRQPCHPAAKELRTVQEPYPKVRSSGP